MAGRDLYLVSLSPYYVDEAVTLYLGDCRDVLPQLGEVDHLMMDPPFSADVYVRMRAPDSKNGSGTPARIGPGLRKMGEGDIGVMTPDLMAFIGAWAADYVRRWAVIFSDVESTHLWRAALERVKTREGAIHCGMKYIRTGAWVKPDAMPQMTGDRPSVGFEPCTIAHAKLRGPMRWNGGGRQALWTHNISKGVERPDHPCPKPLPLLRDILIDFTDPGEVIVDPFAGSATTLRAAKLLGRRAIGIELKEAHAAEAAKWLEHTSLDERYVQLPEVRGKQGALFPKRAKKALSARVGA